MERTATGRKRLVSPRAWLILVLGLAVLVGSQVVMVHQLSRETSDLALQNPSDAQQAKIAGGFASVVSVPPLAWPVRELLPMSPLTVINPPGTGCEQVELTPRQLKDLSFAGFAVTVGFGLDDGVRAALERPRSAPPTVVSLEAIVRAVGEPIESAHDHDHDDGDHGHDHGGPDPHAWLDPIVMKGLVDELARQAKLLRPSESESIEHRAAKLRDICDQIDAEYRDRLAPIKDKRIIVQHSAFSYLARRYGLTIEAVTRPRHDVESTPGDLAQAARLLREKKARVIFVDPPGPDEATKRIAEAAGARVMVLDPLGNGDWPALMRRNLDALVDGLTPPDGAPDKAAP